MIFGSLSKILPCFPFIFCPDIVLSAKVALYSVRNFLFSYIPLCCHPTQRGDLLPGQGVAGGDCRSTTRGQGQRLQPHRTRGAILSGRHAWVHSKTLRTRQAGESPPRDLARSLSRLQAPLGREQQQTGISNEGLSNGGLSNASLSHRSVLVQGRGIPRCDARTIAEDIDDPHARVR